MPDAEASRWISTFLDARAAELGAARNTQLAYGRDLVDFAEWLERRGLGFSAEDFAGPGRDVGGEQQLPGHARHDEKRNDEHE